MPVSSVQSGQQILQQSQSMADEAAQEIAEVSKSNDLEFNKVDSLREDQQSNENKEMKERPASLEDALAKLNQSHTYSQVGTNVVRRSDEMVGTILDTQI